LAQVSFVRIVEGWFLVGEMGGGEISEVAKEPSPVPGADTSACRPRSPLRSAKVFVGGLGLRCGEEDLRQHFATAGEIKLLKVFKDSAGRSKGCGSVEFSSREAAATALATFHGTQLGGLRISCREAVERGQGGGDPRPPPILPPICTQPLFTKVFVSGLDWGTRSEHLKDKFSECGTVASAIVFDNPDTGVSKGCGLVEFASPRAAQLAVDRHHETQEWRGERPEGAEAQALAEERAADDGDLMHGAASKERRKDPADGQLRTYPEVRERYKGMFEPQAIKEYWLKDCKIPGEWPEGGDGAGYGRLHSFGDPMGMGQDPGM